MDPVTPSFDPTDPLALVFGGMPSPERVRALEAVLLDMEQVPVQSESLVHAGMCARTIFIPAGTVATGAQLNKDAINVFVGDLTVTTDTGTRRLTGFNVLPATAGFKRAGVIHADTWWTTLWVTDETDLEAIGREMTDEYDQLQENRRTLPGTPTDPRLEQEKIP